LIAKAESLNILDVHEPEGHYAPVASVPDLPDLSGHSSLVTPARFCEETGMSLGALEQRLRARRVFAVEQHGQVYFPAFYLHKRYDRRQLESVCRVLGDLPGGSKLQFFINPRGSLGGRTPLEALVDGQLALVRRAAQGFLER
jgi:hypothetical protein